MVLHYLFPDNWVETRFFYAILMGASTSLIGIFLAQLLFGANSGLASVMFTAILIIPCMYKLINKLERVQEERVAFSLKRLYNTNKNLIQAYMGIFIGVYLAYLLVSFFGNHLGWDVVSIFREQLFLDFAIQGRATYSFPTLWGILQNNWWVLLSCFGLSLMSGNGAVFFMVWNASSWGAIFGMRAVAAATVLGQGTIKTLLILQAIVLPHVLLEGLAYVLAGIAGGVISRNVISQSAEMKRFLGLFALGIISFFFANAFFKWFAGVPWIIFLRMTFVMLVVFTLRLSFVKEKHRLVFKYNYWLFIIALLVFIIGGVVETGVLSWSGGLSRIYEAAAIYFM